ncbi:MAG: cyoD [Sphingomonas bacterium]|uniref:cytochrome o ubiquinol oxidase subunit IV n=1 Tax=Sphingomonas bacterium TaxID=1895847 RepID=UPI0026126103|nr:cytochrome o ubiquinol oxidase subunit IV [Sphingomonas bacterium]MDB5696487.1 cyoD [Sphingomonas bacterium]
MSDEQAQGSRRGYAVGFALSVVLTALPFWLVMTGALNSVPATAIAIFACAAVQVGVHVVCFLHLDTKAEGGWTLIAFVFTLVIVAIMVGGSIWIMYHINTNTMPGMPGM